MNTKNTYNKEATEYDYNTRVVNIFFDEALEFLINNINSQNENLKVLDVCCGTGILTDYIFKKYPNASITGIDFSNGMLNIAKRRLKEKNFDVVESDILDEKLLDKLGQFDLIVSSFGIHNIYGNKNKLKALLNVMKHLKSGGKYITCDIVKGNNKEECDHYYNYQRDFLLKTFDLEKTEEWLKLLDAEDDPITLNENLKMLEDCSLESVKCIWQKEYLAIWKGIKK